MEIPKFKLSLSGLFAQKSVQTTHPKDENVAPAVSLTDRRGSLLQPRIFTPLPQRQDPKLPQSASSTQPTVLRLLQLDSRVEDTQVYEEDPPRALDNHELYGKNCRRERNVSSLELQVDRKSVDEFKKQSTAIQRELKLMGSATKEKHCQVSVSKNGFKGEETDRVNSLKPGVRSVSRPEHPVLERGTLDETPGKPFNQMETLYRYEHELRQKDEEIATLRRQVQARTQSIRTLEKELGHHSSEPDSSPLLGEICELLGVKNSGNILPAIKRLESSANTAERLERCLADVSSVVCPDRLEASNEVVLVALREWESELHTLKSGKTQESEFAQYFRQVFEIKDSDTLREATNKVFLQSHELKTFCKQLKLMLGLSEDCSLTSVLLMVKQMIRRSSGR